MEYMNNNPIEEEAVFEAPVYETPVVEETVEEHIEETPVVEEAAQAVVETPAYEAPEEVQALGSVADGVIGATTAVKTAPRKKSAKPEEKKETVALYSTKNVTWSEVGKVYRGYNIVDKDAAEKWLTRSHIRTATPEEVAKEFGK
jgi:prophage DNA circulation protein